MNGERLVSHINSVKSWELRRGKNDLLRHLEGGKPLTMRQAIQAKCYDCCGGYPEGAEDCRIEICPLHDFMPFREGGPRKSRTISEAERVKMAERIRSIHGNSRPTEREGR
jgi:hypothetical protein